MKRSLLALAVALAAHAQTAMPAHAPAPSRLTIPRPTRLDPFQASRITGMTAAGLDVLSSRGLYELNPVLGRGPFGGRQASISLGVTAAVLLIQGPIVRKWPHTRRALTITNWIVSGVRVGVAVRNWGIDRR